MHSRRDGDCRDYLTQILDSICSQRGRPRIIRTDDGPEFTGKAMLTWGTATASRFDSSNSKALFY